LGKVENKKEQVQFQHRREDGEKKDRESFQHKSENNGQLPIKMQNRNARKSKCMDR